MVRKKAKFSPLGTKVNNFQQVDNGDGNTAVTVTHETPSRMGQITARDTGYIDIEVLSSENGEMIYYNYCLAKHGVEFDSLLSNYIAYMQK